MIRDTAHFGRVPFSFAMPPMYGQRRSLRSGTKTGTRSFVLKTQWMFRHEKVFAIWDGFNPNSTL